MTGAEVMRSGAAQYLHLVRSPDDPERSPRSARVGESTAWKRKLRTGTLEAWVARIRDHLADGVARTFNRIMVEIADLTADVAFGELPDRAIWELVATGALEHTLAAPIYFRRRIEAP